MVALGKFKRSYLYVFDSEPSEDHPPILPLRPYKSRQFQGGRRLWNLWPAPAVCVQALPTRRPGPSRHPRTPVSTLHAEDPLSPTPALTVCGRLWAFSSVSFSFSIFGVPTSEFSFPLMVPDRVGHLSLLSAGVRVLITETSLNGKNRFSCS